MKKKFRQFFNWISEQVAAVRKLVDKIDIDEAISFAEKVKALVNSQAVEIIVTIFPGEVDNMARRELDRFMELILDGLTISKKCAGLDTYEQRLDCFIKALRDQHPVIQKRIYQTIAAKFLQLRFSRQGAVLSEPQAIIAVESRWEENKGIPDFTFPFKG